MAEPTSLASVAVEVERYLRKAGVWDKVLAWLSRKQAYPVIVVGPTGTGKTSVIERLCGNNKIISRFTRTDSVHSTHVKLESSYIRLIDTPGQLQHDTQRKEGFQDLMRVKSAGLLSVTSFGYHEGKMEAQKAIDGDIARDEFLKLGRETEIRLMDEWTPLLCGSKGAISWLATVVTKADLWWSGKEDQPVLQHYENYSGEYIKAFGECATLPHSTFPYSAENHLFYGKVPMTGYYSDELRREHHNVLIAHLLQKAAEYG